MSSTWLSISLDIADEGQNWDTVKFLVTTLEMILTGLKKKKTNIIFIVHLRNYFVAILMLLSIFCLEYLLVVNCIVTEKQTAKKSGRKYSLDKAIARGKRVLLIHIIIFRCPGIIDQGHIVSAQFVYPFVYKKT